MSPSSDEVLDLLCVGFGPAALALAIALAELSPASAPTAATPRPQPAEYAAIGGLQDALRAAAVRSARPSSSGSPYDGRLRVGFLEKQSEFVWHGGMLLPGSKMQISFLKDLVTMRDPSSGYSFLSYLHAHSPSRLVSFISRSTFTPSRIEYADYMKWAALKVAGELEAGAAKGATGSVWYGEELVSVEPETHSGTEQDDIEILVVTSQQADGTLVRRRARNLCIATGGAARLPTSLSSSEMLASHAAQRVVHTSAFLAAVPAQLDALLAERAASAEAAARPIRVAVLGAGQSAAETFLATRELLAARLDARAPGAVQLGRAEVELVIKKGALHAAEDAAFGNEVFDPGMSHAVYALDDAGRTRVLAEAKRTNYSVVNPDTLEAMYEAMYGQKVAEDGQAHQLHHCAGDLARDPKLAIRALTALADARPSAQREGAVVLTLEHVLTGAREEREFDLVICGTGYDRRGWRRMLFPQGADARGGLAQLFERRAKHSPALAREDDPLVGLAHAAERLSATHLAQPQPTAMVAGLSATSSSAADSYPSSRSSAPSTPLTSPSPSSSRSRGPKCAAGDGDGDAPELGVGPNYRLQLPARTTGGVLFKPTVWLQGANEDSHGISDSLLSVLAVRSAEVVEGIRAEGWFGAR